MTAGSTGNWAVHARAMLVGTNENMANDIEQLSAAAEVLLTPKQRTNNNNNITYCMREPIMTRPSSSSSGEL